MLWGVSSGATLDAIKQVLSKLGEDTQMLVFNYDAGECYFSIDGFLPKE